MRGEFNFFMDVDGKGCDSLKLEACPFRLRWGPFSVQDSNTMEEAAGASP